MCVVKIEQLEVLCTVEPLREECRACRQRLLIDSNDDAGKLDNPSLMGNEAPSMITISRCPQRAV
jgi:hypothetical protein